MHDRAKGLIAINIAAVIFGSAALYGKLDVSPVWIVAIRGMFASGTLLGVAVVRKDLVLPSAGTRLPLIVTGIILSLHWLTFFYSVQLSGVAIATLTFAAFPLFTIILEAFVRKKHLKPLALIAGTLIIVAVALLVRIDTNATGIMWGTALGLLSALLFAIFGIVSKTLTSSLSTISVSLYQNLVVFVGLLPFLAFTSPVPDQAMDWIYLAMLGIITTAIMHQLYLFALKRLTASTCSGFVALEPVYAIVFAAVFFAEPITWTILISGILILIASFLTLKL